jgi:hypothetical protein
VPFGILTNTYSALFGIFNNGMTCWLSGGQNFCVTNAP